MPANRPLISLAIPCYRSRRFLDSLLANLAGLTRPDMEIIISDRHCLDDAVEQIRARHGDDARYVFVQERDGIDWVRHINTILHRARGRYLRWYMHDDIVPADSTEPLLACLEADPTAVLAYGRTVAIDLENQPLPQRQRDAAHPIPPGAPWTRQHSMELFWEGTCDGAFKGLFRRDRVVAAGLDIRPTWGLINSERAWLFGMSLLGALRYVPESEYRKRYYSTSMTAAWRRKRLHLCSAMAVQCDYAWRYIPRRWDRVRAIRYILRRGWAHLRTFPHNPPNPPRWPAGPTAVR